MRACHEGVGLSASWFKMSAKAGVEIRYGSALTGLRQDRRGRVCGVVVRDKDGINEISARAVVLACGGFEANAQWRAQYLGAPWDHAKVRGTRHNQGDGLRLALDIGAMPCGQWSGCHATPISAERLPFPDDSFAVVLAINTLHNLQKPDLIAALQEMERLATRGKFFQVDSYRTQAEKEIFESWVLTAYTHDFPDG